MCSQTSTPAPWDSVTGLPAWPYDSPISRTVHPETAVVAGELLLTERKYLGDLKLLFSISALLAQRALLDRETLHRLFHGLLPLVLFHSTFLNSLEQIVQQPWIAQNWGGVWLEHASCVRCADAPLH